MVTFNIEDKKYELTFTRATAKTAERMGLVLNEEKFENMPLNSIELLFVMAFEAKHSNLSHEKRKEIISNLKNKEALLPVLIDELNSTVESVLADPDDEKNAIEWTVE